MLPNARDHKPVLESLYFHATVYVTHDQVEALSLGGRIAVMKEGKIVQCDTSTRVYDAPANRFVGSFIGNPPIKPRAGS